MATYEHASTHNFGAGADSTLMKCLLCKSLESTIGQDLRLLNTSSNNILNGMTDARQMADTVTSWTSPTTWAAAAGNYASEVNGMIPSPFGGTDGLAGDYTKDFITNVGSNDIWQNPAMLPGIGLSYLDKEFAHSAGSEYAQEGFSGFSQTTPGFNGPIANHLRDWTD